MSGFEGKSTRKADKSLFASVAQPKYAWEELETNVLLGVTALPKTTSKKGTSAQITVPLLDVPDQVVPDVRAIRIHEMLHARFTPEVQAVLEKERTSSGRMSGTAAQIAEDVRLSYIAERNNLFPEDAYFTKKTLNGCVTALMSAGKAAHALSSASSDPATASEATKNFNIGVVSVLGSMHGHPIEGVPDTFGLDAIMEAMRTAAKNEYGDLGLDGVNASLERGARGVAATRSIFDLAKKIYGDVRPSDFDSLTPSQREKRARSDFLKLYSHVSETLERLLVAEEEETEAPNMKLPGQDQKSDSKGDGSQSGGGQGDDGPDKQESKPSEAPEKPKPSPSDEESKDDSESEDEAGGEDGETPNEAPEEDESSADSKAKKKEAIAVKKKASDAIDRAAIMSSARNIHHAATDTIRNALAKKESKERAAPRHPPMAMMGRPTAGGPIGSDDSNILVKEMDLDISLSLDPNVRWTEMPIVRPPLVRAFKARVPRRGRPSIDGEIPRHFSRWFSDKAILDSRGRRPGGTLLLDISGSMSWSHEQTMALIEAVPAMTIAAYSSGTEHYEVYDHNGNHLHMGRLTILAHQGRAVSVDDPWRSKHGGGNGCDGPALAWLARQPGPRVWFSDGGVTGWAGGYSESSGIELILEAQRLMVIGNVWRTTSKVDVVRIFGGLPPMDKGKTSRSIEVVSNWASYVGGDPDTRRLQRNPFVRAAVRRG